MTIPKAMKEATHAILQRGDTIQTRDATCPQTVCDMTNAYDTHIRAF